MKLNDALQRLSATVGFAGRVILSILVLASFVALAPTQAHASISYVQGAEAVTRKTSTLSAAYASAQTAGNMNIVAVGWDSSTITLKSLSDTEGNSYQLAASYIDSNGITQAIYYAPNIVAAAAGTNAVTVTLSSKTSHPDLRILEYSGVNALDKAASAQGTSQTASSGNVTTTQPNELLFGACYNFGTTNGPGSGYTSRLLTPDSDLAEDSIVSSAGVYAATASVSGGSGNDWVMQLATFYSSGATSGSAPAAPTGLTATSASSSQINLSWTASSGATSYNVFDSTTNGGPYTQIASGITAPSYSASSLAASTAYYFVVQAVNANGASGNSPQSSATTTSGSAPAAPTGLTAVSASSNQINLSWTASSGATSYNVFDSTTNGGPYAQIASGITAPSYSASSLAASTAYYFVVQAVNANGSSGNSVPASATTTAQTGGNTYYVSTTGSDAASSNGSQSLPWLTISHAAANVAPGDTVLVGPGNYSEIVNISTSGNSSAPITFNGQGGAVIDGSNLTCCTTPTWISDGNLGNGNLDGTEGLVNFGSENGLSWVTFEGFTVQNFTTTSNSVVPAGIFVATGGSGIVITNNIIQNISSTASVSGSGNNANGPNSYPVGIFGVGSTPLSISFTNNTVTNNLSGQSETVAINGNVQNFTVSGNSIYFNDNIGIDVEGFYGIGPSGFDQPFAGDVYGNTVYENSAINNPGEQAGGGGGYDEDGLYCDGCKQVVFERNTVYANDIGIEAASENGGDNSSDVIIRNNLVYGSNSTGITVGGYNKSACSGDCGGGGSQNIYVLNNTLYNNQLSAYQPESIAAPSGEFQAQYRATGIVFENNLVDAPSGWFINDFGKDNTVTLNYNDYYTSGSSVQFVYNGDTYTSLSKYLSSSNQDANSITTDPEIDALPDCTYNGYTPFGGYTQASGSVSTAANCTGTANFDIPLTSPASNAGSTALGYPSDTNWSTYQTDYPFVGLDDFSGNARINTNGQINIGAYEQ
jgi:Fibronectin type III domain